jgi:hypothetical protein
VTVDAGNTRNIFLNGDNSSIVDVGSVFTLNDNDFFNNFPVDLTPTGIGDTHTGAIFTVTNTGSVAERYSGVFNLLGRAAGSKKSKPNLQYALATEDDLLPIPARELLWKGDILPFWMNRKAEGDGWTDIDRGLPMEVNSAKLVALLRQEFFYGEPVWHYFVQPAVMLGAALLLWFLILSWRSARRERYLWGKPVPLWRELGQKVLSSGAGFRKTTTLAVIREGAEAQGYKVEGFAPTSRAAQKLADAGMETSTLQKHLTLGANPDTGERRLYMRDESSLASTRQMHEFVHRLHPHDRLLLVGDRRQHEAVEAGRPFAQLQDAGMKTVKLEEIVRQKDPELKQVVEQLARGEVREAVQDLERQGRVHEIAGREERITAIAKEYAKSPEGTLVVSPDNRSRVEINLAIHAEMQERGMVSKEEHRIEALVPRQDLTGPERTWAARYEFNDVLRYTRASKETGIKRGEYARVKSVDADKNLLTVVRADGSELTYDPRRQQGVSVYREEPRSFAVGDRIQFTAPANDMKIANRELGTIESIGHDGKLSLKMDGGRDVQLDPREHPHLDHGYAVPSAALTHGPNGWAKISSYSGAGRRNKHRHKQCSFGL